jgi:peptidyl-prolyl cis-trans isomerase B (cyclophilin B)
LKSKYQNGWGYCVFGRVINGIDVIDKIAGYSTTHRDGHADVPEKDVLIKNMTIRDMSTMNKVKID